MIDRELHPRTGDPVPPTPPAGAPGRPASNFDPASRTDDSRMPLLLPAPRHDRAPREAPDPCRAWLDRVFADDASLPAVAARAKPPAAALPAGLADAAARRTAVATCSPSSPAGPTAGSFWRLLASACESRVLVLTPEADCLVEALGRRGGLEVARALAPGERPEHLLPFAAGRTAPALLRRARDEAERLLAEAEACCDRLTAAAAMLDPLGAAADRRTAIDAQRRELAERRGRLAEELRGEADAPAEPTPFTLDRERRRAVYDEERAKLAAEAARLAARCSDLADQADRLRTPADAPDAARKSGLLARFFGRKPPDAERDRKLHDLDDQFRAAREQEAGLQSRLADLAREYASEVDRACEAEAALRRAALSGHDAALEAEAAGLLDAFARASENLTALGLNPVGAASEAVAAAVSELESLSEAARRRRDEARREIADGHPAARQLLAAVPVVVGPFECLDADALTGGAETFDLLLVDRAERLSEAAFLAAGRLARRWVLLGRSARPAQAYESKSSVNGNGVHIRKSKGDAVASDFFARVTRRLDRETWAADGDRLVCRLDPSAAHRRHALACEPLLDRPEVELRFATGGLGEAVLSEIAFPAGTSAVEAKAFLFTRLGEVRLRPTGESHTHDADDAVTVCWPAVDEAGQPAAWVDLHPGVRERVVGAGASAFTAAVAFAKAAGWDADKAVAWCGEHLPAGSPSRAAVLPHNDEADEEEEALVAVAAAG